MTQELTLTMDITSYDENEVREKLAIQYGVPVELISLSTAVPSPSRRRRLTGSVIVTATIEVPSDGETPAADLLSRASAIEAGLGTALGVLVSATAPQAMNKTKIVEFQCPRGSWWA